MDNRNEFTHQPLELEGYQLNLFDEKEIPIYYNNTRFKGNKTKEINDNESSTISNYSK